MVERAIPITVLSGFLTKVIIFEIFTTKDDICMGPLAVYAVKVFGGRGWSLSGSEVHTLTEIFHNFQKWHSKDQPKNARIRMISCMNKMKKKSYGNIQSIKVF